MGVVRAGTIISLNDEDDSSPCIIVLRYRGADVALTKGRLVELLDRENALMELALGRRSGESEQLTTATDDMPGGTTEGVLAGAPSTSAPSEADRTSHASLSNRIKRIFDYSHKTSNLRPSHAGLITDLLRTFDWSVPDHSSSRLEVHLRQIAMWNGVSDELASEIRHFLARYGELRSKGTRSPAAS